MGLFPVAAAGAGVTATGSALSMTIRYSYSDTGMVDRL
jgi:hypothetical protein